MPLELAGPALPRRLVCICTPLGLHPENFFPEKAGADYASTPYLDILKEFRADYTVVRGYRVVTNARGGFFDAAVRPGDAVVAGGVLGTITNVFGELVETLTAPEDALVIGVSTYPAWPSGGWLLELGTGVKVERGRPRN